MKSAIMGMLAESAVHPGSGQSTGFVDLPVAREEATDYPVIFGSSLKGALRERARELNWELGEEDDRKRIDTVFGTQNYAGGLLVSDARLLLLPVRSLNGHYKWVTCPHLLERYVRDARRSGADVQMPSTHLDKLTKGSAIASSMETLFLEERQYTVSITLDNSAADLLKPLVPHEQTRERLGQQLAILHNDDFAWFARYGLSVNARNKLDNDTKESKNLWYEETLPADSLFYAVLAERSNRADDAPLATAKNLFSNGPYLQVGGNQTVGQGWFAIEWLDQGGAQ